MQMSFDFSAARSVQADSEANDYYRLPVSDRQIKFARQIARRRNIDLPDAIQSDRRKLSAWIDAHKQPHPAATRFARYPSSKQVAFAERIARIKRRTVPDECFKDKTLMSRWIDSNR